MIYCEVDTDVVRDWSGMFSTLGAIQICDTLRKNETGLKLTPFSSFSSDFVIRCTWVSWESGDTRWCDTGHGYIYIPLLSYRLSSGNKIYTFVADASKHHYQLTVIIIASKIEVCNNASHTLGKNSQSMGDRQRDQSQIWQSQKRVVQQTRTHRKRSKLK